MKFHAEVIISAKSLRQNCAWHRQESVVWTEWLQASDEGERGERKQMKSINGWKGKSRITLEVAVGNWNSF